MKRTILFLLFLSFLPMLNAQNYKAGYIITHDKEKKYGLIDYNVNSVNSKKCRFKETEDG